MFGFSTENWSRPAAEVAELMGLLKRYVESDLDRLEREGVRVRVIGPPRRACRPNSSGIVDDAEARTAHNDRFLLQVAFNYGGQADIVDAARRFAEEVAAGRRSPQDLDEDHAGRSPVHGRVSAAGPDRAAPRGEQRLSNFLLWEAAYAELVFQDVLWPDYGRGTPAARRWTNIAARDRRYGASRRR